ncbi:putative ABC transporter ATP-binding protein [Neolecta irregularis DAH-3]|uniref:Putative ABC transporter ATP-binding protein n=1 Tax=Neolecta irregularis (strain DAH-3) TaxID=1198029 RepID=A0A1U7LJB7_NEOID|nr:putative ABC transporter ATP-binding protein [Neolecta irregularis DAH-3]|eukprot:OLL22642.1 putative ABC transporter ATP-binding protein [Neolecta irregularis DAH-3]
MSTAHISTSTVHTISTALPNIDPLFVDYTAGISALGLANRGYIDDPSATADEHSVAEALADVAAILLDAGGDPHAVQSLCTSLQSRLLARLAAHTPHNTLTRLDSTVHVGAQHHLSSALALVTGPIDLDALTGRRVESKVDRRKLEKAERKIATKLEKKTIKADYQASKLLDPQKSYEEFYMAVNPLQLGNSGQGISKDIKLESIDLSFVGLKILTEASLTLAYGRRYGLVGRNGIGKSTLLRALSRRELAVPTHISILHVEQELSGDDTLAIQAVLDADVWRKHLLLEQSKTNNRLSELDPLLADPASAPSSLVREHQDLDSRLVDIQNKLAEMDSDGAESRAASILAGLGFSQEKQTNPTRSFSGGWRMRLALARALFCNPDLLLLDEPSNMLDVPSIAFLAKYLQTYKSTVLVVSHDRDFLNETVTDIIYQHSERLDAYKGNFSQFYATKEERTRQAIREYEAQMGYRKHLQQFIDKFRYNAAKSSEAQSRIKKLEKLPILEPPERKILTTFKFPDAEKISMPILQMSNVTFGYSPHQIILKKVDIDVQMDSRIGVIGPNGSGKTTLLKLLTEMLEPSSGLVSRHPRLRIAYFAQHHVDSLDLSVSAVTFMSKRWPGKNEEEYRKHLGNFGISGMLGLQQMSTLSGGQKSRVAFACLGLLNPHILVLDEPTNHLDMDAMDALMDACRTFTGGVILVSHDVTFLASVCNQLWLCSNDCVSKFDGTIKDYQKLVTDNADDAGVVKMPIK